MQSLNASSFLLENCVACSFKENPRLIFFVCVCTSDKLQNNPMKSHDDLNFTQIDLFWITS